MAVEVIPAGHVQGVDNVVVEASAAITASQSGTVVTGLYPWRHATVFIDITDLKLEDGSNEIDLYIQTSYNAGTDWHDVENIHFANANDNDHPLLKLVVLALAMTSTTARTGTDATLADGTKNDIALGDRIRIKIVFANTTGAPQIEFAAWMSLK